MYCRSPGPHPGGKLRGRVSPGGHLQAYTRGGGIPACTVADTPPQRATAAGGTHPTGMHSCSELNLKHFLFYLFLKLT